MSVNNFNTNNDEIDIVFNETDRWVPYLIVVTLVLVLLLIAGALYRQWQTDQTVAMDAPPVVVFDDQLRFSAVSDWNDYAISTELLESGLLLGALADFMLFDSDEFLAAVPFDLASELAEVRRLQQLMDEAVPDMQRFNQFNALNLPLLEQTTTLALVENAPETERVLHHAWVELESFVTTVKRQIDRPRPYMFDTEIQMLLDTPYQEPGAPSRVAAHAYLQAYLLADILGLDLESDEYLTVLSAARAIATYDVMLGLQFPHDILMAEAVAQQFYAQLQYSDTYQTLLTAAQGERELLPLQLDEFVE